MQLKLVLRFVASCLPYIFNNTSEFKPKRAVFVLVMVVVMMFGVDYFGAATIEQAIDLTGDAVSLTEQAK